jgi:hypothetical protein
MDNHLKSSSKSNAVSSLSLSSGDRRGRYYSLGHTDSINVVLSRNNCSEAASDPTTPSTLALLVADRRIQQRYKLLTDGVVQVCRVPHARNIIEKIRFSRFLRRWEDHHIHLEQSDIASKTVRFLYIYILYLIKKKILFLLYRMKVIWIDQYHIQQLKMYLYGQNQK